MCQIFYQDNIEPDDCRIYLPDTQILSINEEQLIACHRVAMNASIDHELMMQVYIMDHINL